MALRIDPGRVLVTVGPDAGDCVSRTPVSARHKWVPSQLGIDQVGGGVEAEAVGGIAVLVGVPVAGGPVFLGVWDVGVGMGELVVALVGVPVGETAVGRVVTAAVDGAGFGLPVLLLMIGVRSWVAGTGDGRTRK